jgi:hypothetical protein
MRRVSGVIRVVKTADFPLMSPWGFRPPPVARFFAIPNSLFVFNM